MNQEIKIIVPLKNAFKKCKKYINIMDLIIHN